MLVAVIGASGFVGSAVTKALLRRGAAVREVKAPRMSSTQDAVGALDYLRLEFKGCDVVVNAAGIATPTATSTEMHFANSVLPGLIASTAREFRVRCIHISSAAVQGRRKILDDSLIYDAFSPYARSKMWGESAALEAGGSVVIYRPPGVHGPERKVTHHLAALARSPLSFVAAPGTQPVAQAWIDNVADAVAFLAMSTQSPPTIVHHPHEGHTASSVLHQLSGTDRAPRQMPSLLARGLTNRTVYTLLPQGLQGHLRRLEIMLLGQAQAPSWLTQQGWRPVVQPDEWASALRSEPLGSRPLRLLYGITAPSAADILLRGQLRYMVDHGWEVHLVANGGDRSERAAARELIEEFHPIEMTRAITPAHDFRSLWQWIRVVRKVRPDVVNVSSPKAALLGSVASYACRVPVRVYVIRGARFESATGLKRRLLVWMEKVSVSCATRVIAISDSLRDLFMREGITTPDDCVVLGSGSSNGVDADLLRTNYAAKNRACIRESLLEESAERFCVLFLGRITRDKGIQELAAAMTEPDMADSVLLMVGDTEEEIIHPSLSLLRKEGRIKQFDHVDDVTTVLAAADVLCLPSHREGMGNVILEASAVGLPVVGTSVTGIVDAIVPNVTGLLCTPGDVEDLARALGKIKHCPELGNRMGRAGAAWVGENFEQQALWEALERIYTAEVLGARKVR